MTLRLFPTAFALTALLAFALPTEALAAKGDRKTRKKAGASLARFDRDGNGKIENKEAAALRRQYEAMAALDADKDGKLSDSEIGGAKVGKQKAGKKKRAAEPGAKKQKGAKKKDASQQN